MEHSHLSVLQKYDPQTLHFDFPLMCVCSSDLNSWVKYLHSAPCKHGTRVTNVYHISLNRCPDIISYLGPGVKTRPTFKWARCL